MLWLVTAFIILLDLQNLLAPRSGLLTCRWPTNGTEACPCLGEKDIGSSVLEVDQSGPLEIGPHWREIATDTFSLPQTLPLLARK